MAVTMNPYLNFQGKAEEAMGFYASVLGGELTIMRFSDMGGMGLPEDEQGLVMHSQLVAPSGTLMGADSPSYLEHAPGKNAFSVSLSGPADEEATLRGYWDKLAEGATITMPLEKAPWGDVFGTLTDRYGIDWMFNVGTSS